MLAPGFRNTPADPERTSDASGSGAVLLVVLAVLLYWFLYL